MIPTLYDIFKPWSDGGSVYLLSDTHFDDADCKLMDPKWILPEQQVEQIEKVKRAGVFMNPHPVAISEDANFKKVKQHK